jgi:SAM-dependent methyltransferase
MDGIDPGASTCRICGSDTSSAGQVTGRLTPRSFELRRCAECGFGFVLDPWTDYEAIYSDDYYAGRGADPLVDYLFELEDPKRTVRRYEWRGLVRVLESITELTESTRWLDFGCGNGGLVRYAQSQGFKGAVGFEEGAIATRAAQEGIPFVSRSDLAGLEGSFDVITAIEVLEHVVDPLEELRGLRRLLRPGGLFLCTTGNAAPYADRLSTWRYVQPEIHISFFEPRTLELALRETGFRPEYRGFAPGYADVIKFKVLKNLGFPRDTALTRLLPAWPVARLADLRAGVTAHPVGWAA